MLSADLLEDVGLHLAVNTPHRITTKNIDVVDLGQLVTEFLIFDHSLHITFCPQEMCSFSENYNAGMFPIRSPCCRRNEITKGLHKPNWIKPVIDHECREGICSTQCNVSTLLNGR